MFKLNPHAWRGCEHPRFGILQGAYEGARLTVGDRCRVKVSDDKSVVGLWRRPKPDITKPRANAGRGLATREIPRWGKPTAS